MKPNKDFDKRQLSKANVASVMEAAETLVERLRDTDWVYIQSNYDY